MIILAVGVLAVIGVIALTNNDGKSNSPLDSAVPPTTAPPTSSVVAAGQPVTISGNGFTDTFTVSTCQPVGKRGLVLSGVDANGAALRLAAPNGTGSLAVTTGGDPGTLVYSANVTSARLGPGGQFQLGGTFNSSESGPTGPFTATGFCG